MKNIFKNERGNIVNPFLSKEKKERIVILKKQDRAKGFWNCFLRTCARLGFETHHGDILFKTFFIKKGFKFRRYAKP